ncbi:HD-GYP domain-containing protein [bacterium]|nr:HD-GYP domain-containing protein [bacterium]
MRLARPVPLPTNPTRYLLQRDVCVSDEMRRRLAELGISEVWIRCDELEFLETVVDAELGERQREIYSCIRRNFERFMRLADAKLDFESFRSSLSNLFDYLKNNTTGICFLDRVQVFDDYLLTHSTNVGYLAMLLGMKLDWYLIKERKSLPPGKAKEVISLGLGCLLHDVGKMRISKEILDKPSRLTPDEMDEIRKHPSIGYEMVKGEIPLVASQVVLHHHQRWDGKGYPRMLNSQTGEPLDVLAGDKIPIFGRIATICDVFDAATSKRVYSDAKPSVQVLCEMLRYNAGCFDPVVQKAFYEIVPAFPIGTVVTLTNGFVAAVVDFDPKHPCQPRVKPIRYPDGEPCRYPDNREIDLSTVDLTIHFQGDVDVRPFLFEVAEAAGTPRDESRLSVSSPVLA